MPETPAPSSRTVEVDARRECVKRKFVGRESQVAKRGVTFHTTEMGGQFEIRDWTQMAETGPVR
jgi:hypothetical protein